MKYVPPIGAADGAPYVDANPAAGIEGSLVPAAAIEHPQREIMNVIQEAGLDPDGNDLTQLAAAIAKLIDEALVNHLAVQGQCRLEKSGANLVLKRCNGNTLFIDGAVYVIPEEGVTLPPTGLTPDTTYNIYAYMDSGVMKLEAAPIAAVDDSTYGHKTKAGDPRRTLVGKGRVIAGPAWVDTDSQRFVLSYFNRRAKPIVGASTNGQTTTSTSPVELTTAARAEFLTWGDEAVSIHLSGRSQNSAAGFSSMVQVGVDGAGVGVSTQAQSPTPNGPEPQSAGYAVLLAEGYHYITPLGWVSGNTGTFHVQVHGTIQG